MSYLFCFCIKDNFINLLTVIMKNTLKTILLCFKSCLSNLKRRLESTNLFYSRGPWLYVINGVIFWSKGQGGLKSFQGKLPFFGEKILSFRLWPGYFRGMCGLISSSPRAVKLKYFPADLELLLSFLMSLWIRSLDCSGRKKLMSKLYTVINRFTTLPKPMHYLYSGTNKSCTDHLEALSLAKPYFFVPSNRWCTVQVSHLYTKRAEGVCM